MSGEGISVAKRNTTTDALSPRDKGIVDDFASGSTRKQIAERLKLTPERIGQIVRSPAAVAYLAQRGGIAKTLLFAKVGEEILSRTEWGGMKMADLLAIWKAAMPQQLAVNITDHRKEAEAIAAEIGKADDPAVVAQIERDLLISQEPMR